MISIGNNAFSGCTGLETLVIEDGPDKLEVGFYKWYDSSSGNICKGLFYECPLKNVYLGRNITCEAGTNYNYLPFYEQTKLTNLTIGNYVTKIGDYSFFNSYKLTSLTIGSSIASIGICAFSDKNSALESITSLATTAPSAHQYAFSTAKNYYPNATLYVPTGSLESYQSSTCWKKFLIKEIDVTGVVNAKTDKGVVEKARYSLEGKKLSSPVKGMNIIRMSDGTTKKVLLK